MSLPNTYGSRDFRIKHMMCVACRVSCATISKSPPAKGQKMLSQTTSPCPSTTTIVTEMLLKHGRPFVFGRKDKAHLDCILTLLRANHVQIVCPKRDEGSEVGRRQLRYTGRGVTRQSTSARTEYRTRYLSMHVPSAAKHSESSRFGI